MEKVNPVFFCFFFTSPVFNFQVFYVFYFSFSLPADFLKPFLHSRNSLAVLFKDLWNASSVFKWTNVLFCAHRSDLLLDLQWIPNVCEAGQPALHLTGDGESVHRQNGAFGCWKLHLCGDQHSHKDPCPGPAHSAGAPQHR